MTDWIDPAEQLPNDGESVEVRLVGGDKKKPVEFLGGRFWKYRSGNGGHAYNVAAWRPIGGKRAEKERVIDDTI